ncbi:MAG: hypothetical protein ACE37B_09560 [Ilumatobacter sp.]|uniref:hypothetical protein n=1 Tax=Ilumatobacter sp. TaxID=1967498 RepID=UPI00391AC9E2
MHGGETSPDRHLLRALDELDRAIAANVTRSEEIRKRVRHLHQRVAAGERVADLIEAEDQPRTVEMLTENIDTLHGIGSQLRAAQARALRDEGLTIAAIAELFGVTRQRVSALLRQKSAEVGRNDAH